MKAVKEICITVLKKDNKTNIEIPFDLPYDADRLIIKMSYSPKIPDDRELQILEAKANIERDAPGKWAEEYNPESFLPLKNLITVSLDDSFGYRGCAHRQANSQEHIIEKNFASPGFYCGEIKKGIWKITLNVHAIVTEKCECNISVFADGGEVL